MDNVLIGTITSSVLLLIGVVYTAYANNKLLAKNKALDIALEKQKIDAQQNIIKYDVVTHLLKFSQYQKIYDAVINLMSHSKVDRFLIFIAVNGKTELNNVTCIFQKFRNDMATLDAVSVYKGLKVDQHYVQLLKQMELNGEVTLQTAAIEPSLIKDIYENEKVKWSKWKFIGRINIDENSDVITYCSAASFEDTEFDSQDTLAIKLNVEGVVKPEILKAVKEKKINNN